MSRPQNLPDPENVFCYESGTDTKKASPMTYAFTPVPLPTLPIKGSDKLFPIHRIYCVGRNYAEHTKEMGGDTKDPPFFFQKNADNVRHRWQVSLPFGHQGRAFRDRAGRGAEVGRLNIKPADAMGHVFGYGVGIDMTRRDLQAEAKKLQRPWEVGKAFEASAPCTALVPPSMWRTRPRAPSGSTSTASASRPAISAR